MPRSSSLPGTLAVRLWRSTSTSVSMARWPTSTRRRCGRRGCKRWRGSTGAVPSGGGGHSRVFVLGAASHPDDGVQQRRETGLQTVARLVSLCFCQWRRSWARRRLTPTGKCSWRWRILVPSSRNKLQEFVGGALGEFYKAECAKANGLTKWVDHWTTEADRLLSFMATQVYLHPVRGFRDRRKALARRCRVDGTG